MKTHIWFRAESKPLEKRAALTPEAAQALIQAGFRITVEDSIDRAFAIDDYHKVGCGIAASHSWRESDSQTIVLGLKEIEVDDRPLRHRHIYFAHVYKQQQGWQSVLNRFMDGGGTLYDLEYLVNEDERRIAAFGYWAGFAGAVLAIQAWCGLRNDSNPVLDTVRSRPSQDDLVEETRHQWDRLKDGDSNTNDSIRNPKVLVIGAIGRSGRGAVQACQQIGLDVAQWDVAETKAGGPFPEILSYDILVNCVFVQQPMPPFITLELLNHPDRKLGIVCDVSCDPYGEYNPLPIYDHCTTFQVPTLAICKDHPALHLIAIDHLPSLLPVESSVDYCQQLLPALLQLNDLESPIWKRAENLFHEKSAAARL